MTAVVALRKKGDTMVACEGEINDQASRASPLSILELSSGDSGESTMGRSISSDAIEIVADLGRHEERRYCDVSILPTIQEITASEEEQGETKNEQQHENSSIILDELSSLGHVSMLSARTANNTSKCEARQMMGEASLQASKGNEDKGLEIYKEALHILRRGVKDVSNEMELASAQPKLEKTALYIVLHEEWSEFASIITEIRCAMAALYERQENYDKCIRNLEEAKSIYQHQATFDERHHRKGSNASHRELAMEEKVRNLEEAKGSWLARQSLHETIRRIREKIDATKDETSLDFLYEDLHEQISIVLSLETIHLGESHPQVADSKELLSIMHFERGQVEKSFQLIHNAAEIVEQTLGMTHPRTGLKYKQIGKMYEKVGGTKNRSFAIEFYEKAIATLKASGGPFSNEICSLLHDVGVLYLRQKDYGPAIKSLDEANQICVQNIKKGGDDISSMISIEIWLNLAECYSLSSEKDLAVSAIRKALNIQQRLRQSHEVENKKKKRKLVPALVSPQGVAKTLKRLGKVLASQGKFSQAYEQLLEALSLLREDHDAATVAATSDPTVDVSESQDEIASALFTLAEMKQAGQKSAEAKHLYHEALQLRRESDRMRPVGQKKNHVHCAMCLAGIGSVELQNRDSSEAYKIFNAAIHIVKKEHLPDSHPIVNMLWHQSHLASRKMLMDCAIETKAEF